MEEKPDWNYTYIESLEQKIAIHKTTGIMYTQDKTRYSEQEASLLQNINYQIPKSVHIIKRIFSGTILSI